MRVLALATAAALGGCATLERLAELPNVDFFIDEARETRLAGVAIDGVRGVNDLRPTDYLAIVDAVRRGRLPLRFNLHVGAENAAPYEYDLRLERLEWTLLLEDRDTVSGVFDQNVVIAAAGTTDIPVPVELDLMQFFDEGASDLLGVALRIAGVGGGEPANVKLRARPTLNTPVGSYRFPSEITIASRDI